MPTAYCLLPTEDTEATANHGGTGHGEQKKTSAPVSASREMVEPRRIHKP
jgi:hypothetical protein